MELKYCMIEVLLSDGGMGKCVYKKDGMEWTQWKKHCKDEVLRTKVKRIGTGDWCGFKLRLSELNGEGGISINITIQCIIFDLF